MKKVTLTMKGSGFVPGQGWYGTLSFEDETYLAMASNEGLKKGKYTGERTVRGAIKVAGFEIYPENHLQQGGKQISFGGKWNKAWGLFDTNPAWKSFMDYFTRVKEENLKTLREDAIEQKADMEEELLELLVEVDKMKDGDDKLDALSSIEEFKVQISSIDISLNYYQPEIEIIVG